MPVMSVPKSLIYIVAGGVAIALGTDWVVDGATTVASAMGISQTLIGLLQWWLLEPAFRSLQPPSWQQRKRKWIWPSETSSVPTFSTF